MIAGLIAEIGDLALQIIKWGLRASLVLIALFGFMGILGYALSMIVIGINGSVVGDLLALIQIWLPFDLSVIMLWVVTGSVLYLGYRLSIAAVNFLQRVIGTE